MTRNVTLTVGPNTDDGETVEIIRCIQSRDDVTESENSVIRYKCQGVESVDVDDPWEMGGLQHSCQIGVRFVTGRREYLWGIITSTGSLENDD
jgi:hypothetical protein